MGNRTKPEDVKPPKQKDKSEKYIAYNESTCKAISCTKRKFNFRHFVKNIFGKPSPKQVSSSKLVKSTVCLISQRSMHTLKRSLNYISSTSKPQNKSFYKSHAGSTTNTMLKIPSLKSNKISNLCREGTKLVNVGSQMLNHKLEKSINAPVSYGLMNQSLTGEEYLSSNLSKTCMQRSSIKSCEISSDSTNKNLSSVSESKFDQISKSSSRLLSKEIEDLLRKVDFMETQVLKSEKYSCSTSLSSSIKKMKVSTSKEEKSSTLKHRLSSSEVDKLLEKVDLMATRVCKSKNKYVSKLSGSENNLILSTAKKAEKPNLKSRLGCSEVEKFLEDVDLMKFKVVNSKNSFYSKSSLNNLQNNLRVSIPKVSRKTISSSHLDSNELQKPLSSFDLRSVNVQKPKNSSCSNLSGSENNFNISVSKSAKKINSSRLSSSKIEELLKDVDLMSFTVFKSQKNSFPEISGLKNMSKVSKSKQCDHELKDLTSTNKLENSVNNMTIDENEIK